MITWRCDKGHGIYCAAGQLEELLQQTKDVPMAALDLWHDRQRFVVERSYLNSPEGPYALMEIRDPQYANVSIYGDPKTHSLWIHQGELEKLIAYCERIAQADALSGYAQLLADAVLEIWDDDVPLTSSGAHVLSALRLMAERVARAMPNIAF
jgi:Zn-finger nucleic acid-binding protein